MAVTPTFLRCALQDLPGPHVASRRADHPAKATRLDTISHRLDRLAVMLSGIAAASIVPRQLRRAGAALHPLPCACSRLARRIDGVVVDGIGSWPAVCGGQPIALPA